VLVPVAQDRGRRQSARAFSGTGGAHPLSPRRRGACGRNALRLGGVGFLDPWGNHIQVVDYRAVQFTKAPWVLAGMGLSALEKSVAASEELDAKGLLPAPAE